MHTYVHARIQTYEAINETPGRVRLREHARSVLLSRRHESEMATVMTNFAPVASELTAIDATPLTAEELTIVEKVHSTFVRVQTLGAIVHTHP